jgi:hypothetical protein
MFGDDISPSMYELIRNTLAFIGESAPNEPTTKTESDFLQVRSYTPCSIFHPPR